MDGKVTEKYKVKISEIKGKSSRGYKWAQEVELEDKLPNPDYA